MKRILALLLCVAMLVSACSPQEKAPDPKQPEKDDTEEISGEREEIPEPTEEQFEGLLKEKMHYQAAHTNQVPYEPIEVTPNLPAYSVEPGLNNVANLDVSDLDLRCWRLWRKTCW